MFLSLSPVVNFTFVAIVAAVLLALLWVALRRDKLTPARRATLVALRVAVIALVAVAMLRPAWVHTIITRQAATLVLLLDQSRSMQVADAAGKQTRWQALSAAVYEAVPGLVDLERELEVQVFTFDRDLQALDWDDGHFKLPESPGGGESAIGYALEELVRRTSGKRLAGVVLVSDGAQRTTTDRDLAPQVAARRLADLGFALHTIPLGQGRGIGQSRDIALSDLRVPPSVFVKNKLPIQANLHVAGYVNQKLPVQLLVETAPGVMTPAEAQPVQPREDGQDFPILLEHLPERSGEIKVTIQVPPQPGETITVNNTLSTFVTINSEGLSVLYLEGVSRVEQKFMRRAMDSSPDIRVDYLRLDAQRPQLNPADIASRFEPGKYDVYILGDLDSAALTTEVWQALADAVNGGSGLIMLGGLHSFGAGNYGQTPLAAVLPVQIGRLERQPFGESIRGDLHLNQPTRMQLTAAGKTQSLLALDSDTNAASIWKALPLLDGANRFAGLKPGAQTLLESERGEALLVSKNFGAGRVLAFAGDSTWRWPLYGFAGAHKRFWRQTILWLAQKELRSEGRVWLALDRRRFAPGARVEFRTGARSEQGETLPDAKFDVKVTAPDGRQSSARLERTADGEQRGLALDTLTPGDYTIETTAQVAGVTLGVAKARFLVYEQDLELENPAADPGTLEALAAMTGGQTLAPERLGDLVSEIRKNANQFDIESQVKETLWDTWPFFLVFISLLSTEWYLRKKWGLV